jgi:hypothetical protein
MPSVASSSSSKRPTHFLPRPRSLEARAGRRAERPGAFHDPALFRKTGRPRQRPELFPSLSLDLRFDRPGQKVSEQGRVSVCETTLFRNELLLVVYEPLEISCDALEVCRFCLVLPLATPWQLARSDRRFETTTRTKP